MSTVVDNAIHLCLLVFSCSSLVGKQLAGLQTLIPAFVVAEVLIGCDLNLNLVV